METDRMGGCCGKGREGIVRDCGKENDERERVYVVETGGEDKVWFRPQG